MVEILASPAFDERGAFLRSWSRAGFAAAGIDFAPTEISMSENPHRLTLRGLHYQVRPAEEAKLVRCLRGAAHDVALDLRAGSPTYRQHGATLLSAERRNAVFIPRGCAHGFLTLADDTVLEYMIDTPHAPDLARGVRWDDPAFGIAWPAMPAVISPKDRAWPDHG